MCASFSENGATQLYYDNAVKLATTSSGVTVTGTINGGDLRGEAWTIGRDGNDYIVVDSNKIDFALDTILTCVLRMMVTYTLMVM